MSEWISVKTRLPELGDYSVLAHFDHGGMAMVHVMDYFAPMTAGLDEVGEQKYTKWYISQGVTHWMDMPEPPKD